MNPKFRLVTLTAFALFSWACTKSDSDGWKNHDAKLKALKSAMTDKLSELQSAHGSGECDSTAQCRVVGMGQKTCGGYSDFLVYSTKTADESRLLEALKEYNSLAEEWSKISLRAAPCGRQPKPVSCVRSECVVEP